MGPRSTCVGVGCRPLHGQVVSGEEPLIIWRMLRGVPLNPRLAFGKEIRGETRGLPKMRAVVFGARGGGYARVLRALAVKTIDARPFSRGDCGGVVPTGSMHRRWPKAFLPTLPKVAPKRFYYPVARLYITFRILRHFLPPSILSYRVRKLKADRCRKPSSSFFLLLSFRLWR